MALELAVGLSADLSVPSNICLCCKSSCARSEGSTTGLATAAAPPAEDRDEREQKLFELFYPGVHISWGIVVQAPHIVFVLMKFSIMMSGAG